MPNDKARARKRKRRPHAKPRTTRAADPAAPRLTGRNRETDPRRVQHLMQLKQVLKMRQHGHTLSAIAEQLGYANKGTVSKMLQEALLDCRADIETTTSELKALEISRLENMLTRLMTPIENGDLKAIDRAIKIGERRARLLGLEAPIKMAPTTPDGDKPYEPDTTEAQRLSRVLELLDAAKQRREAGAKPS